MNDIITCKEVLPKEHIILDWNVIKYIKSPRSEKHCDALMRDLIEKLRKKYYFPFCECHLRDLKTSFKPGNEKYINDDLEHLKNISNNVGVLPNDTLDLLAECSVRDCFKIILEEESSAIVLPQKIHSTRIIDMKKLDKNHPLRPLLEKTDGILSPDCFYKWLIEKYETFFDEREDYCMTRKYVEKINDELCLDDITDPYGKQLIECEKPFFESLLIKDKDELKKVWKNVVDSWLSINFVNSSPKPFEVLSLSYALLDMHPSFNDKITKKNKPCNMIRDSKLVCYAASSKYLVTEDEGCYKKAKFLYSVYGYKTKVFTIEEFVRKFEY